MEMKMIMIASFVLAMATFFIGVGWGKELQRRYADRFKDYRAAPRPPRQNIKMR